MSTRPTDIRSIGINIGLWVGIATGAIIAGIVTLLLTPRSGKDTRMMIKNRAIQAKEAIVWHAEEEARSIRHGGNGHKKQLT